MANIPIICARKLSLTGRRTTASIGPVRFNAPASISQPVRTDTGLDSPVTRARSRSVAPETMRTSTGIRSPAAILRTVPGTTASTAIVRCPPEGVISTASRTARRASPVIALRALSRILWSSQRPIRRKNVSVTAASKNTCSPPRTVS